LQPLKTVLALKKNRQKRQNISATWPSTTRATTA
jgi:hypothetical protein